MRSALITVATSMLALATIVAQPAGNTAWIGVWTAQLDGQPGTTLTLGDDAGELGGTLVMNMVSREGGQPHVIETDTHVLIAPRLEGDTLTFSIKRMHNTDQPAQFSVTLIGNGKAKTRCLNCGADAPVVELVRSR
jgi:hypothetical protein